jgi:hypothetical protein
MTEIRERLDTLETALAAALKDPDRAQEVQALEVQAIELEQELVVWEIEAAGW